MQSSLSCSGEDAKGEACNTVNWLWVFVRPRGVNERISTGGCGFVIQRVDYCETCWTKRSILASDRRVNSI
jgi:hypothetical protein